MLALLRQLPSLRHQSRERVICELYEVLKWYERKIGHQLADLVQPDHNSTIVNLHEMRRRHWLCG